MKCMKLGNETVYYSVRIKHELDERVRHTSFFIQVNSSQCNNISFANLPAKLRSCYGNWLYGNVSNMILSPQIMGETYL